LERQDLSCTYLAHHQLDSEFIVIIIIVIVIVMIITTVIITIIIIIIIVYYYYAAGVAGHAVSITAGPGGLPDPSVQGYCGRCPPQR